MLDVSILGNTRGQTLEFPIEMAGHLYNRAGATAQPAISQSSVETHLRCGGIYNNYMIAD